MRFLDDVDEFLALAGDDYLAAEPVVTTIVSVQARRAQRAKEAGISPAPDDWWLVVSDEAGRVVGVAMENSPPMPHTAFALPMPGGAALAVAEAIADRGERLRGVNGALPSARTIADEYVRLVGGHVHTEVHTRLFEATEVVRPTPAAGSMRLAEDADLDLVHSWFVAFHEDAAAQGGREPGDEHPVVRREEISARIAAGQIRLWIDASGSPVSMTGITPPAFGVTRVGPVFTPAEHRGHGYAANTVARVTADLLASGQRACLFTDQANPVSNRLYVALGYRAVTDMANLLIVR